MNSHRVVILVLKESARKAQFGKKNRTIRENAWFATSGPFIKQQDFLSGGHHYRHWATTVALSLGGL